MMYKKFIFNATKHLITFLHSIGFKVHRVGPYSIFDFENFLYRHLAVHKTLTFLQIGANDGIIDDPIYQFNIDNRSVVSGFVLGPLPDIYGKLVKNYRFCPSVKPFNVAIHATEAEMVMHRVKPSRENEVPAFARGIASFDEAHWKKSTLVPDPEYIEQVTVKCVSFADFVKSQAIENLDLLLIDTEGYDFHGLMSIDFSVIKPKIIRFEHGIRNEVMSPENFASVCKNLNSLGYQVIADSYDATAYLLDSSDLVF